MLNESLLLYQIVWKNDNFQINTPTCTAAVRGTTFFVSHENKSSSVSCIDGKVEVSSPISMQRKFTCKRIVLPDHKYQENLSINQINKTLNLLEKLMDDGPVFVHCVASIERSPLICMAWLVRHCNLNPFESLEYLMQIHPITNPLPIQFSLLKDI